MDTDGRDNFVAFSIDHTHIVRSGIDDVNLILLAIGSDSGRLPPHFQCPDRRKRPQVDHTDRIALSIGDVGVLTVGGAIIGQIALMEIPPAESSGGGDRENCKEELSQGESRSCETGSLRKRYGKWRETPKHLAANYRSGFSRTSLSHCPAHHWRDLPHLRHQLIELVGIERLHAIGQGLIRLRMNLDEQTIGT